MCSVSASNTAHDQYSDNVSGHYRKVAADTSLGARPREIALLLVTAEGKAETGDLEGALKVATDALAAARKAELGDATVDAMRLVLHARRGKVEVQRVESDSASFRSRADAELGEVEAMASEELQRCIAIDDAHGKAAMLLSLAEIRCDRPGDDPCNEAQLWAVESSAIYEKLGNSQMCAKAFRVIAHIHIQRHEIQAALLAAGEAASRCQAVGDILGGAKALHLTAVAKMLAGKSRDAISSATAALQVFRDLGLKALEAAELQCIASWHLLQKRPRQALPLAEEALTIFQDIKQGLGGQASALGTVVQALIAIGDKGKAVRLATVGLRGFQESGSRRDQAVAWELLALARLAKDADEEALQAAEASLSLIQDIGDRRSEAKAFGLVAQVHLRRGDLGEATRALREAQSISQELLDVQSESNVLRIMTDVHLARRDMTQALQCAVDQQELMRHAGDNKCQAMALLTVSRVHAAGGDGEKAIVAAREALEMFAEIRDVQGEASANHVIAELHLGREEYDDALVAAKAATLMFREADNRPGQVRALRTTSNVHMEMDDPDAAVKTTEEALRVCRKYMTDKHQEVELLMQLANVNMGVVVKDNHGTVHVENVQESYQYQQPAHLAAPQPQQQEQAGLTASGGAQEVVVAKKGLDPAQVLSLIASALESMVGTGEDVSLDTPLMDSGLDSLSSVQFRNDLQKQTGLSLPASIMFDYPTQKSLGERLVELSLEE